MPKIRSPFLSAVAIVGTLVAGCTSSVNLATKRGTYDAYLDLPTKTDARLQEKTSFYNSMLEQTDTPKASPYPSLAGDLSAMQRAVDTMGSFKEAIVSFEGHYDKFSYGKTVVRSDQAADWQEYQGLDQQFQPLRQSIQVSLEAFNAAATDFDLQVQLHHIEEIDAAAMREEIDHFRNHVDQTLTQLEDEARQDRQSLDLAYTTEGDSQVQDERRVVLEQAQHSTTAADEAPQDHQASQPATGNDGDRQVLEKKRAILEQMEHSLLNVEEYQRTTRSMADALYESLPEDGSIWTGPGMADDGSRWVQLRQAEDLFRRREERFADLGQQFNAIAWPPALGSAYEQLRVVPPHP
jgi:hypothetical protein